jgi:hypothetical protein
MSMSYESPAQYVNRTERTTQDAVNHYTAQLQELLAVLATEPDKKNER